MDKSPFYKADDRLAAQAIPFILWNPKVHYLLRKITIFDHILSQLSPLQTLPSYNL
jgi:hypothetical protein